MNPLALPLAPLLYGASEVSPRKHADKWSMLFAVAGVAAGINGLRLAEQDRIDEAVDFDIASIFLDLLAIKKAIEAGG